MYTLYEMSTGVGGTKLALWQIWTTSVVEFDAVMCPPNTKLIGLTA